MNLVVVFGAGVIILLGMIMTLISTDRYQKLIYLSLIAAGAMPFLAERGYLDVLTALAIITPISTIFILMVCRRTK